MRGLDLDVLRPPTYKRLAQVLRAAQDSGRPYGIVHFDGHGTYLDLTAENDTNLRGCHHQRRGRSAMAATVTLCSKTPPRPQTSNWSTGKPGRSPS